jgi:hypothetical protein
MQIMAEAKGHPQINAKDDRAAAKFGGENFYSNGIRLDSVLRLRDAPLVKPRIVSFK